MINHTTVMITLTLLLCACSQPTRNFDRRAASLGYTKQLVKGDPFLHAYYLNSHARITDRVYVYIHGDGSPWKNRLHVSEDPTPRYPLSLKLMHKGPQPAIYLGRPCYHGQAGSSFCDQRYWTSGRYSNRIIVSMRAALRRILATYPKIKITLIGYSGGGTLAVLMASDFAKVDQVITLAGNLDTDSWSKRHHYSPLPDSLNPILQPPLPTSIRQIHFAGELDQNVPASMIREYALHQSHAEVVVMPHFTHKCCWEEAWPEPLESITY